MSLWFVWVAISSTARWAFATARWEVIPANLTPLLIGTYPRGQVWRIWTALLTVAFLAGATAGTAGGRGKRVAAWVAPLALASLLFPLRWPTRVMLGAAVALVAGGYWLFRGKRRLWPWLAGAWFFSFPWILFLMWGIEGSGAMPRVETERVGRPRAHAHPGDGRDCGVASHRDPPGAGPQEQPPGDLVVLDGVD